MADNSAGEKKRAFLPPAVVRHWSAEAANFLESYFQKRLGLSADAIAGKAGGRNEKYQTHVFLVRNLHSVAATMGEIEEAERNGNPGAYGFRVREGLARIRESLCQGYIALKAVAEFDTQRMDPHVSEAKPPAFSKENIESICNGIAGSLASAGHAAAIMQDGTFREPPKGKGNPLYDAVATGVIEHHMHRALQEYSQYQELRKQPITLQRYYHPYSFFQAGMMAARREIQGKITDRIPPHEDTGAPGGAL